MDEYKHESQVGVHEEVSVYERTEQFDHVTCTVIAVLVPESVIVVDDDKAYRIAHWIGSDDQRWQF